MFGPYIELIDCQSLYNLLNEGIEYSKLCDTNYLYLIDCRERSNYNEGHIICAKHMKKDSSSNEFRLLYESELQCRNTIIVYDSNTSSLQDNGPANKCAKLLFENGSKNSVKILRGGYEAFSRHYPFLRTQQIIYMPRELDQLKTYPSEIIPGLLYLGNSRHGNDLNTRKEMKIKSFVDCSTTESSENQSEKSIDYLKIPIRDDPEESIKEYLQEAFNFIDVNVKNRKQPCLVFSDLGISRSAAIVIAYLIYSEKLTLEESFERVTKCKKIQPQIKFLNEIREFFANR
ncbi:unnamed protein product [Brachionus calyciflorus]|uniref:Uncharacterized protein n=1 Tax=Brachionus calyciflorus TaxID=104777 RepID=A0A813QRE9_9BILA|nr:unnamed protein product [Brachionus calyciflorus]